MSQFDLAKHLEEGCGCARDEKEASRWSSKKAEEGLIKAQSALAHMLVSGRGCQRDEKEAFKWFLKLAEDQANVAVMLHDGIGCSRNPPEAWTWAMKSAEQGHPVGLHMVGALRELGLGGIDGGSPVDWYKKAAATGYRPSIDVLRRMGVTLDTSIVGAPEGGCSNPFCTTLTGPGRESRQRALKRCSRCKKAKYCNVVCQQGHWASGHKDVCKQQE